MGNECAWGGACPAHPSPSLPLLTHYTPLLRGVTLRGKVSAVAWGGELEQEVRTSPYLFCAASRPPALHPSSPSFSFPSPPSRTPRRWERSSQGADRPTCRRDVCISRAAGVHMCLRRNRWLHRRQSYALAALPVGLNSHSAHVHLRTRCLRERLIGVCWARCTPPSLRLAPPSLPSHPSAHSDPRARRLHRVPARAETVLSAARGSRMCEQAGVACGRAEFARTGMPRVPSPSSPRPSFPLPSPLRLRTLYAAVFM
ncbi:hypothetical protein C8F04DRAFT_1131931 [Mycena alexandri]|uniref:Uncharacterized protein n=1 Tax=Mycena alexandri TaxID=1745969 RepID=A0AAD6SDQ8_9AGAR|nr:hypothetical protein C8F04DRAFT_1131931 [Mycena alexandri]